MLEFNPNKAQTSSIIHTRTNSILTLDEKPITSNQRFSFGCANRKCLAQLFFPLRFIKHNLLSLINFLSPQMSWLYIRRMNLIRVNEDNYQCKRCKWITFFSVIIHTKSWCPQNKLTRQDRREGGILGLLKLTDLLKIALNLISFIQNV